MYRYDKRDEIWYGHQDDPKPTNVDINDKCYEYETGDVYIWDGENWIKMG